MDNEDYIRKGAGLIGWKVDSDNLAYPEVDGMPNYVSLSWGWVQDIIAAQLIRLVDALPDYFVSTTEGIAMVHKQLNDNTDRSEGYYEMDGDDRIMVTIKAIVDSKVLVGGE